MPTPTPSPTPLTPIPLLQRSPRVVYVFGVVTVDSSYLGLVLEYCSGGSLRNRLDVDRPVEDGWRRVWLSDIATGMQYLYEHGVEHRDLKTGNVLLGEFARSVLPRPTASDVTPTLAPAHYANPTQTTKSAQSSLTLAYRNRKI